MGGVLANDYSMRLRWSYVAWFEWNWLQETKNTAIMSEREILNFLGINKSNIATTYLGLLTILIHICPFQMVMIRVKAIIRPMTKEIRES